MKSYILKHSNLLLENGSYKDLGDAKIVDKSWDTEGTQFNIKGFQASPFLSMLPLLPFQFRQYIRRDTVNQPL